MAIKNLEKMDIYNPTNYVNNSEPDIDADNLNKTENKLEETVAKANEIIDALKTLISTVQTNSDNTVPSSSLAYVMQQEIAKNKEDIATANSNLSKKVGNWEYIGNSFKDVVLPVGKYSEVYVCVYIGDDNSKMIPCLLPLSTLDQSPGSASDDHPRFVYLAGSTDNWAVLHYSNSLVRLQNSSVGSTSIFVYGR